MSQGNTIQQNISQFQDNVGSGNHEHDLRAWMEAGGRASDIEDDAESMASNVSSTNMMDSNPWTCDSYITPADVADITKHDKSLDDILKDFQNKSKAITSTSVYGVALQNKVHELTNLRQQRRTLISNMLLFKSLLETTPKNDSAIQGQAMTHILLSEIEKSIRQIIKELTSTFRTKEKSAEYLIYPSVVFKEKATYSIEELRMTCPIVSDKDNSRDLKTTWSKLCQFGQINKFSQRDYVACLGILLQGRYYRAIEASMKKPLADVLQALTDSFGSSETSAEAEYKLENIKLKKNEGLKAAMRRCELYVDEILSGTPEEEVPGKKQMMLEDALKCLTPSNMKAHLIYEVMRARNHGVSLSVQERIELLDALFKSQKAFKPVQEMINAEANQVSTLVDPNTNSKSGKEVVMDHKFVDSKRGFDNMEEHHPVDYCRGREDAVEEYQFDNSYIPY